MKDANFKSLMFSPWGGVRSGRGSADYIAIFHVQVQKYNVLTLQVLKFRVQTTGVVTYQTSMKFP